jgi:gp16 family phage-associated protein
MQTQPGISTQPEQHAVIDMATANQFRAFLQAQNTPASQWGRERGFRPMAVSRVLNGWDQGRFGQARDVANAILSTLAANEQRQSVN